MKFKVVTMNRTVALNTSKDNGPKKKMPKFVCWSNKRKSGISLRGNSRVDLGSHVGNGGVII